MNKYIYVIGFIFTGIIMSIVKKDIKLDIFTLYFISVTIIGLTFIIKYINKNNVDDKKEKKNIKELITKEGLILAITGTIGWLGSIYVLKELPLSIALPLGSISLFIAMGFEKLLLHKNIDITTILIFILFIIGLLLVNLHSLKVGRFNYYLIILLILYTTCQAFQNVYTKKLLDNYNSDEIIIMEYIITICFAIILCMINYKQFFNSTKKYKSIIFMIIIVLIFRNVRTYSRLKGIENLDVDEWNLLSRLTIIISIIIGYFYYNEYISIQKILGAIIILFSIYLLKSENYHHTLHNIFHIPYV